jgi:hypothetical protein
MLRSLTDVQAEFAAALLDPAAAAPGDVADPQGNPAPRRFAVYRNNVAVGLVNAVGGVFPAVKRIVGDEFFNAMALAYVRAEPPTSPVLLQYGQGFANFIAGFAPGWPTLPTLRGSNGHGARPTMPRRAYALGRATSPGLPRRIFPC